MRFCKVWTFSALLHIGEGSFKQREEIGYIIRRSPPLFQTASELESIFPEDEANLREKQNELSIFVKTPGAALPDVEAYLWKCIAYVKQGSFVIK